MNRSNKINSLLTLVRNLLWSSPWFPCDHLGSINRLLRLRFKRRLILLRSSPWFPTGLGLLLHGEVVKLTVPFLITSSSVSSMASICPPLAFLVWTSSPSLVSAPPSLESALSFFGRPLKKGYSTRMNWDRWNLFLASPLLTSAADIFLAAAPSAFFGLPLQQHHYIDHFIRITSCLAKTFGPKVTR